MKDRLKKKLKKLKSKPSADFLFDKGKLEAANKNAEINSYIARGRENVEDLFIITKNEVPHLFEKFKEVVFTDMTSDAIEEFYRRIAHKEDFAAGRVTEPPPPFVMPPRKEYAMPAEYKRHLESLAAMIESRDENLRLISTLPPEAQAEAALPMRQLNDAIENLEQKMADEYERYQDEQESAEARRSSLAVRHWIKTARQFLFIKKYQPQALAVFKEEWMKDEDWLDIARWIDRLAAEGYDPPPAPVADDKQAEN